jgi:general secretion pathway protein G
MIQTQRHARAGFSMIELMIYISIVAVLAAVGVPIWNTIRESARESKVNATFESLKTAIMSYYITTGSMYYPTKLRDLEFAPTDEKMKGKWRGPYMNDVPEDDPWGNPYVYKVTPGKKYPYELYSYGPNGPEGAKEERIGNWN